jgi:hypothetical protein
VSAALGRRARPALAVAALLGVAGRVGAQTCVAARPTDAEGYLGFAYEGADVASFAAGPGGRTVVWYARTGPHAPDLTSTRPDGVPDHVARAAAVGDDALGRYEAMGFRRPPRDDDAPPCAAGADGRLDVYLVNFQGGSDGLAANSTCLEAGPVVACSTFVLVESRLEATYGTFDRGVRTVLPHELFHAVQNAYDVEFDRYWAEGTAQWAADALDPTLDDLERFLPEFFEKPGRPLDSSGGGVVAGHLYGSAIWPAFLTRRHGADLVRQAFERQAQAGGRALDAVDNVLATHDASIATEFPLFAAWNAATGQRAAPDGYPDAAAYPEVSVDALADAGPTAGRLAGLSAAYYAFDAERPRRLAIEADPSRLAAFYLPLEGGGANLASAMPLPFDASGEGVIVVAGTSASLTDANFVLSAEPTSEPPPVPPTPPAPTTPPAPPVAGDMSPPPATGAPAGPPPGYQREADEGCSLGAPSGPRRGRAPWAWAVATALLARRGVRARRRGRS